MYMWWTVHIKVLEDAFGGDVRFRGRRPLQPRSDGAKVL